MSKLVKAAGVRVRDHERVPVDLEEAARLQDEGLTLTQIAVKLGVSRTTLIKARRVARQE